MQNIPPIPNVTDERDELPGAEALAALMESTMSRDMTRTERDNDERDESVSEHEETDHADWVQFYPRVPRDIRRSIMTLAAEENVPPGALLTFSHLFLLQHYQQLKGKIRPWYDEWRHASDSDSETTPSDQ